MTARFYLRPASAADATALHALRTQIRGELFPDADLAANLAEELDALVKILVDPGSVGLWIGQLGDEIVGYARADALGAGFDRMLILRWIALREDVRRQGYGTKLITAALGGLPAFALAATSDSDAAKAGRAFLEHNEFVPTTADAGDSGHESLEFETFIR